MVFERAEWSLATAVADALAELPDARQRLLALGPVTIDVLTREPVVQRIVFVEAPVALGWSRWRALDGGASLRMVRDLLDELVASAMLVDGVDPRTAAQVLLGAINEAGMHAAAVPAQSSVAGRQLRLLCQGLLADREEQGDSPELSSQRAEVVI